MCTCAQLCPTQGRWDPPGSSLHGILQARILEWVTISYSRESSQPRDQIQVSRLLHWQEDSFPLGHQGSP